MFAGLNYHFFVSFISFH